MRDAIDFDVLVHRADASGDANARAAAAPLAANRDAAFLAWLDARRRNEPRPSPGDAHARGLGLVATLATVAGLAVGAGLAGALLARHEEEPINALLFLGATAGLQVVVLVAVALAWLARRAGLRIAPLHDAVAALVAAGSRLATRGLGHLDGERRASWQVRAAESEGRMRRLGPLFAVEAVLVTQAFAIAFNIGLLAVMLLIYLPFVELRFGWQSTYSFTAAGVDAWVHAIAWPWSWIADGLVPTPDQVARSRYARGQRAETLPLDAARAWWPFLLSAVACYGLAIRTAIAIAAAWWLRHRLAHRTLADPAANALRRAIEGVDGPWLKADRDGPSLPYDEARSMSHVDPRIDVLVVDRELDDARTAGVRTTAGATVVASVDDDRLDAELARALAASRRVVVAIGEERDPVVAIADFLRAVAACEYSGIDLSIRLVPTGASNVDPARTTIWRRFVVIQRLDVDVEDAP